MPYVLIGSVKHAVCADWISQMCHVGWLDLSNMPWGLIESVKYAICADWICKACCVCWLDLSNMPCVLTGSVKHAMWADWICQVCHMVWLSLWRMPCVLFDLSTCHVGWLDMSDMSCGLIGSVKHAMWAYWICQSCCVGWLDLSVMPYELTLYVSCPSLQFQYAWFLALFQLIWKSSSSACCTPPYWCWLFVQLEWNKACVNWDPQQVEEIKEMSPHGMFIRSSQPSCWGECLV
jgi:hypothetical protein